LGRIAAWSENQPPLTIQIIPMPFAFAGVKTSSVSAVPYFLP
jgi:hypothetical protein